MKCKIKKNIAGIAGAILVAFLLLPDCWAKTEVTIIGEVNDTHQIVADTVIYEVDDNKLGNDLVYNYISARVKVTGFVTEKDDMKFITVTSFEVVPD
jgi:hypothetical protein